MPAAPPAITADHLRGLPGLRRAARQAILAEQPRTVLQALRLPDVGRKVTRHLLDLGLITDPERIQERSVAQAEREDRCRYA